MLWFPDQGFFLWIPMSAADADGVNPNGYETLLANLLRAFFINGNPTFINWPRTLLGNPLDCTILDSRVFDNFVLADE